MEIDPQIIVFLGVLLAVFVRTMLPYIRKLREARRSDPPKDLPFDKTFLVTAAVALIVSLVTTLLVLPAALAAMPENVSNLVLFSAAFCFGYTANDIINEVIS